jgi:hypothetical protein
MKDRIYSLKLPIKSFEEVDRRRNYFELVKGQDIPKSSLKRGVKSSIDLHNDPKTKNYVSDKINVLHKLNDLEVDLE